MKIGIPEALLYHRYKPFVKAFFSSLDLDIVYSGPTNRSILEEGIKNSVDEACLPIKIFQGHVAKLLKESDRVVVPRIMKCEFGDSICPKFSGLPELIGKGQNNNNFIFTEPMYLNDKKKLKRMLANQGRQLGQDKYSIYEAVSAAEKLVCQTVKGDTNSNKEDGKCHIAVLGHPYNISDNFTNMDLFKKLKAKGVNAISGDDFNFVKIKKVFPDLIKQPYWMFYRENLSRAASLVGSGRIDGIIYLSSFNCGTDSVTIEMIRNRIKGFPMLIIKLDEHTGEAGVETRLEAFVELLERRKEHEVNFSKIRS